MTLPELAIRRHVTMLMILVATTLWLDRIISN